MMSLAVRYGGNTPYRAREFGAPHTNAVTGVANKEHRKMGKKLYVGNLAFDVTTKELEELFGQAGICESAAVITDRATGQSRGFGFVEMGSNADAQQAIQQFDGHELKG